MASQTPSDTNDLPNSIADLKILRDHLRETGCEDWAKAVEFALAQIQEPGRLNLYLNATYKVRLHGLEMDARLVRYVRHEPRFSDRLDPIMGFVQRRQFPGFTLEFAVDDVTLLDPTNAVT